MVAKRAQELTRLAQALKERNPFRINFDDKGNAVVGFESDRYRVTPNDAVGQELRPFVAEVNFLRILAGVTRSHNEARQSPQAAESILLDFFRKAQEFGLNPEELVDLHNRTAVWFATANDQAQKVFGPTNDERYLVPFNDTLPRIIRTLNLPFSTTLYRNQANFQTPDLADRVRYNQGYALYQPTREQITYNSYLVQEHIREMEGEAQSFIAPVFLEGRKLQAAHAVLADEQTVLSEKFSQKLVAAALDRTRLGNPYASSEQVRAKKTRGDQLATEAGQIAPEISQLDAMQSYHYEGLLDNWQRTYEGRLSSRVERLKLKLGQGDIAREKKEVEDEIWKRTGQRFDISSQEGRGQARKTIIEAVRADREKKSAEIAHTLQTAVEKAGSPEDRASAFLQGTTIPAFNQQDASQVVEKIKLPVQPEKQLTGSVRFQEKDLAKDDLRLRPPNQQQDFTQLVILFLAEEDAITGPTRKALTQIGESHGEAINQVVRQIQERLGGRQNDGFQNGNTARILAENLQRILRNSLRRRADGVHAEDFDPLRLQQIDNRDLQEGFRKELDLLRKRIEQRKTVKAA